MLCMILRRAGSDRPARLFYIVAETLAGSSMTATSTNTKNYLIFSMYSFYFSSLMLILSVTASGSFTDA